MFGMAGAILNFFDKEFNFEFEAKPNFVSGTIFVFLIVVAFKCILNELSKTEMNVEKDYLDDEEAGSSSGDSVCTESVDGHTFCICNDKDGEMWRLRRKEQLERYAAEVMAKKCAQLKKKQQLEERKLKAHEKRREQLLQQARDNAACSSTANVVTRNMGMAHIAEESDGASLPRQGKMAEMLHDISNLESPKPITYSSADVDSKPTRCKSI